MNSQSRNILIITTLMAIAGVWGAYRPAPSQENYETVTGTVASATAVSKEGDNEFRIKVWLEGQETGYQLVAKVPGSVLGREEIGPGVQAEMLALKTEREKPFKGLLGNVEPSVEIASLTVDGHKISTWEDRLKAEEEQKQMFFILMVGAPLFGIGTVLARRFQSK